MRQIAKLPQGGAGTRPGRIEKLLGPQSWPHREEDFRGCEDPVGVHWPPEVQSHLPHPTHLHAEVACALAPHDPDAQATEQVGLVCHLAQFFGAGHIGASLQPQGAQEIAPPQLKNPAPGLHLLRGVGGKDEV